MHLSFITASKDGPYLERPRRFSARDPSAAILIHAPIETCHPIWRPQHEFAKLVTWLHATFIRKSNNVFDMIFLQHITLGNEGNEMDVHVALNKAATDPSLIHFEEKDIFHESIFVSTFNFLSMVFLLQGAMAHDKKGKMTK